MKKIYSLIAMLTLSVSVYAQSLVPSNVTSVVYGLPSDGQLQGFVQIQNATANLIAVGCERIELSIVPGSENNFCWGPVCYPSSTSMSFLPDTILAGAVNTTFIGDYQPKHSTGISSIDYRFFDVDNPNDAVIVNIKYDTQTLGIDNLSSLSPYLNVASGTGNSLIAVSYNTSGNNDNQLKIYNLLGNNVKNIRINKNGTMVISSAGLSKGVYVFCLQSDGKTVATKKFIVSK